MDTRSCFRLLITSISYLLLLNKTLAHSHSLFHTHHRTRIPTNVTKHLHFQNFSINEIKLLGNAVISRDNYGFIQIPDPLSPTVDHAHQAGRAIYSSPIRLFDPLTLTPASFQTTFSFQFTTTSNTTLGGSGLAFIISSDEFTVGRAGPWLGILNDACDRYKVFAVEFDSSHDTKFGDTNDDHVGINLGSAVSFKTANISSDDSLHDHNSIHRAWIVYDGHRKWIDIFLGIDGNPLPLQPILSTPLNLSPFFKEYMFVGFSASTGDSPQIHNIFSWNFSSTIQALLHVPLKQTCHRNIAHQVSKYSITNQTHAPSSFLIFVSIVGLCTISFLNLYCYSKHNYNTMSDFVFPHKKQRPLPASKPRCFAVHELYSATKRFSKMEILSSDSRGLLYRGTLLPSSGCYVAVKRFSDQCHLSSSDWTRVLRRISSITEAIHPSLAPIRGWCCDSRERMVVYNYFQNGSLDRWLFGLGVLPWTRKFKLVKDIAEALSFLHSKELTHGNLKSSSVFLDIDYRAVLGDYGFIFNHGRGDAVVLSKKKDVFGFGKLVLEIVAGKRSLKTEEEDEETDVLGFAWAMHERGEKVKVVDERMGSYVNKEQAIRVLEIGLCCTLSERNGKPSMEEVVQILNMQKQIPKLPPSRPT